LPDPATCQPAIRLVSEWPDERSRLDPTRDIHEIKPS